MPDSYSLFDIGGFSMPATPVQKTARQRFFSAVSAVVLLVAVPVGALLLWNSSAGTARAALTSTSIGVVQNQQMTARLNFFLSLRTLSPQQQIQATAAQRTSDAKPPVPSTNAPTRARF